MKTFLKIFFGIFFGLVLLVVITLAIVFGRLIDTKDNTPYDAYNPTPTTASIQSALEAKMSAEIELAGKDYIMFGLTELEINRLIYAVIKENLNANYDPENKEYAYTMETKVPIIGNANLTIKSVYARLEDGELIIEAPVRVQQIRTRLILRFKIGINEAGDIELSISQLKLGKYDLQAKTFKSLRDALGKKLQEKQAQLNQQFLDAGLSISLTFEPLRIVIDRDALAQKISETAQSEEDLPADREMFTQIARTLLDRDNDLIDVGVFNGTFGLQIDVKRLRVESKTLLDATQFTGFDSNHFAKTKVQGVLVDSLSGKATHDVIITSHEFNQIVYNQTNQYKKFQAGFEFDINVLALQFSFGYPKTQIIVDVNFNGLITQVFLTATVTGNNTNRLVFNLDEHAFVGRDNVGDARDTYVITTPEIIYPLIGDRLSNISVIEYIPEENVLAISASGFTQIMKIYGSADHTPLTMETLRIENGKLIITAHLAETSAAYTQLNQVTNDVRNYIQTGGVDSVAFDTSDPAQAAEVAEFQAAAAALETEINSGEPLNEATVHAFVDQMNDLSPENQAALAQSLENNVSPEAQTNITNLYTSLFQEA